MLPCQHKIWLAPRFVKVNTYNIVYLWLTGLPHGATMTEKYYHVTGRVLRGHGLQSYPRAYCKVRIDK